MKKKTRRRSGNSSVRLTVSIPTFLYKVVERRVREVNAQGKAFAREAWAPVSLGHIVREALRRDPTLFPIAPPVSPSGEPGVGS